MESPAQNLYAKKKLGIGEVDPVIIISGALKAMLEVGSREVEPLDHVPAEPSLQLAFRRRLSRGARSEEPPERPDSAFPPFTPVV